MRWDKVDARWKKRKDTPPGGKLESDVTYSVEMWPIPGEDPLEVRICVRAGHPMSSFCTTRESEKTSIVVHTTAGYGGFTTLMGGDGDGRQASAHFMLGRDGIAYLLVKTEYVAWHATWWNDNSVGIEVDTICQLFKKGNNLHSEYGPNDVYCTMSDTGAFMEKPWPGHGNARYWATWTEEQYVGCARLLKAISHKHNIPRVVLPEPARYNPFPPVDRAAERTAHRKKFKGLCTHLNIDPARRIDIGPFIDWDKLLRYGEYKTADCLSPPAYTPPVGGMALYTPGAASGGGTSGGASSGGGAASGGGSASSGGGKGGTPSGGSGAAAGGTSTGGTSTGGGKGGAAAGGTSGTTQDNTQLPPPVQIDNRTIRVRVGQKGGRIALTVRKPGEPMPTTPKPGDLPAAAADGKRDEFIRAAMNFLGCPYKAGSDKPKDGVDGAGLISLCLKRVGLLKEEDADFDGAALYGIWPHMGGKKDSVPEEILPGDIAWFGKGDHDTDACQHPMIYLGGGRVLGPLAAGGSNDGAVQVVHIKDVPENFGGWTHIDDLGVKTEHTAHPGEPEVAGVKLTGALLPLAPASRYDALKELVKRHKGTWDDGKGKINLVGVKNLHDRSMISPRPDDWNDTLFAAFLDEDGHKCCLELKASLNPGTDTAKKDTWQLWEGTFKFKLADGEKIGAKALQPDGNIKGWLDKEGTGAPRVLDPKPDPKGGGDQPKPKTDTPDNPEGGAAAPGGAFVFDAASKKLSVKFGVRMMRALMEWELKEIAKGKFQGCLYSSYPGSPPYEAPAPIPNAWPDLRPLMKIQPPKKLSHAGKDWDIWHAFGMNWGAVHQTNCCNSQMAAVFAANPDGVIRIKRDSGIEEVDVVNDSPPAEGLKNKGKPVVKDSKGYVFAVTWIQGGGNPYTKDGKSLFGGFQKTAPAWAMEWLGVGESICNWGDRKSLKKVRIGDDGMWMSHNWLVGDVRYKITFTNGKTARCDQSSFARVEKGVVEKFDLHGGRDATKEDCEWIEANEPEFEKRIAAFYDAKKLELFGEELDVKSIEPVAASVFSGNAQHWSDKDGTEHGTAGGKVYKKMPGGDWAYDESYTKYVANILGVSRMWSGFPDNGAFGFARWYDNAGGGQLKPGTAKPAGAPDKPATKNDVSVVLSTPDGKAAAGLAWQITLPDGSKKDGKTGDDGKIAASGTKPGKFKLVLPAFEDGDGAAAAGDAPAEDKPAKEEVPVTNPATVDPEHGHEKHSEEHESPDEPIYKHDDPRLSANRKKLLAELDSRLPSHDGVTPDAGHKNLFDGVVRQTNGTSCGLLPTVLMLYGMKIAKHDGIAGVFGYGTEGIKEVGRKLGVWVESDGVALPKPGDLYTLRYEGKDGEDSVSHVGVIVDVDPADGSQWVTGDSGQDQGGVRGATYCHRLMHKTDGKHPYLKGEFTSALRRLGGWVDFDLLMAKVGK